MTRFPSYPIFFWLPLAVFGTLSCSQQPPAQAPQPQLAIASSQPSKIKHPAIDAEQYQASKRDSDLIEEAPQLNQWSERYPDAAQELTQWARSHKMTSAELFGWMHEHPIQARSLVEWTVGHPYDSIDTFLFDRRGWDDFQHILSKDPKAVGGFLAWCRHSPYATKELSAYRGGMQWAGDHIDTLMAKEKEAKPQTPVNQAAKTHAE